jgi:hypothetical protein
VIGLLILVVLPRNGYDVETSRTLLFLYASISQLLLAYSSRRIVTIPRLNLALHLTVLLCLSVQLLTVLLPALRALLGLEALNLVALSWVAGAVVISCGAAEIYSRIAVNSNSQRSQSSRAN